MIKMYKIPGSDRLWECILVGGVITGFSMVGYASNAVAEDAKHTQVQLDQKVVYEQPKIQPLVTRKHYSPNYTNGRKKAIDTIVLHTTEGTGKGAEDWLTNKQSEASAHYLILENGEIVQLVNEDDTAWHCRRYNADTIGIEIAGHYNQSLNEVQIKQAANLIKNIRQRKGNLSIKPHSELDPARRKDPGKENLEKILRLLQ